MGPYLGTCPRTNGASTRVMMVRRGDEHYMDGSLEPRDRTHGANLYRGDAGRFTGSDNVANGLTRKSSKDMMMRRADAGG